MPPASGKTYAIHPAFGIARFGNADANPTDPSTWYLGAEAPYQTPNEGQPYKQGGKIKKQAQRFRVYEFVDGKATREITLDESDIQSIEWTVHMANRKAALNSTLEPGSISRPAVQPPKPHGMDGTPPSDANYWPAATRNADVKAEDRGQLCLDPGPQSVSGSCESKELVGTVTFPTESGASASKDVTIGTICTESGSGRLLVFAGNGESEGLDDNGRFSTAPKLKDFGNNNKWYDDSADGSIVATVTFNDGTQITIDQPHQRAWVACASPRFAPALNWITNLYDVAESECHDGDVERPSFKRHIYPLLRCASLLPWVSTRASRGHSTPQGYYLAADRMNPLSSNDEAYKPARVAIFKRMRDPNQDLYDIETIQKFMPQVSDDLTRKRPPSEGKGDYDVATITKLQYARFQAWSEGNFDADGTPEYEPLEQMEIADQPEALDRAAVQGTCGAPFYPGIESWRILRTQGIYADGIPLRMNESTQPGDLTMGNALPWQADYLDCNDIWWPVQRPNEVYRDGQPASWVPESWNPTDEHFNEMVDHWSQLGFVVSEENGSRYVETERNLDDSNPT